MIKINSKNKSTTIRLTEKTKKILEQLSIGKETHEKIILRLIKNSQNLENTGTKLVKEGNILGTKYNTIHKTIDLKIDDKKYVVVYTYNDLSPFSFVRKNYLIEEKITGYSNLKNIDWEIDLEIVNIDLGKGWTSPEKINKEELKLIYFICIKNVIEESFDLKIYEIINSQDFLNIDIWNQIYTKYNLSKDSFNNDIKRKLK
jgi:hypothetical protein